MRAVVRGARHLASAMLPGTPVEPHACDLAGHVTTRFTSAQLAATTGKRLPDCARRGCDGRVLRVSELAAKRADAWRELGPGWTEPIL